MQPSRAQEVAPEHKKSSASRAATAVLDQTVNATTNLLAVVMVATTSDAGIFALFALQQTILLGLQWTWQAGYTEQILRAGPSDSLGRARWSVNRTLPCLLLTALLLIGYMYVLMRGASPSLGGYIALPFTACGLVGLGIVRAAAYAAGCGRVALHSNVVYGTLQCIGTAVAVHVTDDLTFVWVAWGCAALVAMGAGVGMLNRIRPVQILPVPNPFRFRHALDSGIATTSGQIAVIACSLTLGVSFAGALRGAMLLLGPATLLGTASKNWLTPAIARRGVNGAWVVTTLSLGAMALALGLLLQLTPSTLGRHILGDTWDAARHAVAPVSAIIAAQLVFDSIFVACRARGFDTLCTASRLLLVGAAGAAVFTAFTTHDEFWTLWAWALSTTIAAASLWWFASRSANWRASD